jgi:membrane-bound metal-dependent hydrolase YbcI (DUF457 family)
MLGLPIMQISPFWGCVFSLAITLHFLRDSLGTGWGVKLLWPLSNKNYKFLQN